MEAVVQLQCRMKRKTWLYFVGLSGNKKEEKFSIFYKNDEIMNRFVCVCGCRHVMNELLETERAYVEELLCVLQVIYQHISVVQ